MIIISPKTKIGELLEAYPQLEPLLISMSPAFEKLKNPILRRTVAKVATIQQISVVGKIPVEEIINRLRREVGQENFSNEHPESAAPEKVPSWFDEKKIKLRFNASPIINAGESPMNEILSKTRDLGLKEIMELQTPFIPEPILDMLRKKGFLVYPVQKGGEVFTYITKG